MSIKEQQHQNVRHFIFFNTLIVKALTKTLLKPLLLVIIVTIPFYNFGQTWNDVSISSPSSEDRIVDEDASQVLVRGTSRPTQSSILAIPREPILK